MQFFLLAIYQERFSLKTEKIQRGCCFMCWLNVFCKSKMYLFFYLAQQPPVDQGLPIVED